MLEVSNNAQMLFILSHSRSFVDMQIRVNKLPALFFLRRLEKTLFKVVVCLLQCNTFTVLADRSRD